MAARYYLSEGRWDDGRFWRRVAAAENGTTRSTPWLADCSAANSEAFKAMREALDAINEGRATFQTFPAMFKQD